MAKRFIDNTIVKKQWFAELTNFEKAAWFYILCECDAVGVYDINTVIEKAVLSKSIDFDTLIKKSSDNLEYLNKNKIFILNYCTIQYGESITDVNTKSKPLMAHHRLLRKHGLYERVTYRVNVTPKEKEKEKVKEKEKEATEKNIKRFSSAADLTDEEWTKEKKAFKTEEGMV